jgi:hypothetical protein
MGAPVVFIRSAEVHGRIVHEAIAFTPSNENSRFGYFRGNVVLARPPFTATSMAMTH